MGFLLRILALFVGLRLLYLAVRRIILPGGVQGRQEFHRTTRPRDQHLEDLTDQPIEDAEVEEAP
jgi:hypothetical protein